MSKKQPTGVMCYWEFVSDEAKKNNGARSLWKLVESFPIDIDGYPLAKTSTQDYSDHRNQWMGWLNKDMPSKDEEGDWPEQEPNMGRAVTIWTFDFGTNLLGFNPPEYVRWLSVEFVNKIKSRSDWHSFFECGHELYLGTARAAEKIILEKKK